jgi:23S rRNA pseudouridine2605 synthase
MSEMRLQKWLSQLGIASRREAEKWISEGRLAVNGKRVVELGTKVNIETDRVFLDGKLVKSKVPPKVYWLLHKPDKILTARSDDNKPTIYDIPTIAKAKFLVSPVGRLDFRTEGLLLLTNDGELSYKLCRPEYHVPREYQVLLDGRLTREQELEIRKGVELEDGPVKNVKITFVHGANMGVSTGAWYIITVHEGRNRLVRRLFEHFNRRVVRLIRVAFGEIRLPADLPAGEYRQLTTDEVVKLKKATDAPIEKSSGASKISKARKRALRKPLSARPKEAAPRSLSAKARRPKAEATTAPQRDSVQSRPSAKPSKTNPSKSKSTRSNFVKKPASSSTGIKSRPSSKSGHKKSGHSKTSGSRRG